MSESVLIVGLSWLGDSIMAMPAIQAYRRVRPGARLAMLVKPKCRDLWSLHPDIDEIIECPETVAGTARAVVEVKGRGFEAAFILPHSFRSALVPFLAGVPRRTGLPGHCRDWMLSDVVRPNAGSGRDHQSFEYIQLFGLSGLPPDLPRLLIPRALAERASTLLEGTDRAPIALIPGAAYGPSKRWPADRFAEAGRLLNGKLKCNILVLGSMAERELCAQVAGAIGQGAVDLSGRTSVPELAAVLARCSAVLANDSGGMHLAAAAGAPVVAVFGITDPARTGPLGRRIRVLQDSGFKSRDLDRDSRPAVESLLRITAERALDAVRDIMRRD